MTYLQLLGLVVLVFFCAFMIVDRVCKCCEQCSMTKAFGKHAKIVQEKAKNNDNFE